MIQSSASDNDLEPAVANNWFFMLPLFFYLLFLNVLIAVIWRDALDRFPLETTCPLAQPTGRRRHRTIPSDSPMTRRHTAPKS